MSSRETGDENAAWRREISPKQGGGGENHDGGGRLASSKHTYITDETHTHTQIPNVQPRVII